MKGVSMRRRGRRRFCGGQRSTTLLQRCGPHCRAVETCASAVISARVATRRAGCGAGASGCVGVGVCHRTESERQAGECMGETVDITQSERQAGVRAHHVVVKHARHIRRPRPEAVPKEERVREGFVGCQEDGVWAVQLQKCAPLGVFLGRLRSSDDLAAGAAITRWIVCPRGTGSCYYRSKECSRHIE